MGGFRWVSEMYAGIWFGMLEGFFLFFPTLQNSIKQKVAIIFPRRSKNRDSTRHIRSKNNAIVDKIHIALFVLCVTPQ